MARKYLAMYLRVQMSLGDTGQIVPVRHFSANTARLAQALKDDTLFTDLTLAKNELEFAKAQAPFRLSVLLDSSLPGRKNIIKGKAKENMDALMPTLVGALAQNKAVPSIGGPSCTFTLTCGIKTAKKKYPVDFVSESDFTGSGFTFSHFGGADFSLSGAFTMGILLFVINFSNVGGPLTTMEF